MSQREQVRTEARSRVLRVAGTIALGAAGHQIATGLRGVRGIGPQQITPNVDSELRFYAAWYAAAGVLMHQAAADRRLDRQVGRAVTGGWALAAAGRLLSLRAVGRPDPLFLGLTALEIGLAALLAATHPEEVASSTAAR